MPLIGQLLLALPFKLIISDSILATRIASQFYMLCGLLWLYKLLPKEKSDLIYVLLFNPMFLLSYWFMTDGYFTVTLGISIVLAYKNKWVPSLLIFALASSIRDISIVFLPFYALALYAKQNSYKDTILRTVAYFLIFLLITQGWRMVLETSPGGLPELYDEGRRRLIASISRNPVKIGLTVVKNMVATLPFLGVMLYPILLLTGKKFTRYKSPIVFGILGAAAFFIIPTAILNEISGQVAEVYSIIDHGKGNEFLLSLGSDMKVRTALALAAGFGLWSLTSFVFLNYIKRKSNSISYYLFNNIDLLVCFAYILLVSIAGSFPRYMYVPFIVLLISSSFKHSSISLAEVNKKSIVTFCIISVHFLMLNKGYINTRYMRAELVEMGEQLGADKSNFDAGFEYGGYYNYDYDFQVRVQDKWWWVLDDRFIVSSYYIEGYIVVSFKNTYSYLPYYNKLYLLERKEN